MTVKYDSSSKPSFCQGEYTHSHPSVASVFELKQRQLPHYIRSNSFQAWEAKEELKKKLIRIYGKVQDCRSFAMDCQDKTPPSFQFLKSAEQTDNEILKFIETRLEKL